MVEIAIGFIILVAFMFAIGFVGGIFEKIDTVAPKLVDGLALVFCVLLLLGVSYGLGTLFFSFIGRGP